MAFSRRSEKCRKFVRVAIGERDSDRRALLGEELSKHDFPAQDLSDEQVLLDTGVLRQADVIVLGRTRSIASALSLSAGLSDAGVRARIVNLAGRVSARTGNEVVPHVGPVLRIDDMLRDLGQLVQTIRQQAGPPRGDVVRGALTLRQDGAVLWKDVEVPLTPSERAIVKLLAWNFPQFVSCDAIYALGHAAPDAAAADENRRRTNVQLAVRNIRRKFRACDPAFRGIKSHRGFGYGLDTRVWRRAPAGQIVHWPIKT